MNGHRSGDYSINTKERTKRKRFEPSNYEYPVEYNDQFETPIEAYKDILPLLDSIAPAREAISSKKETSHADDDATKQGRKEHIIYDPYYCNGRTKVLLRSLGFDNVFHEKRDFYKDIQECKIPRHHTIVTNPPYSDDHKEKCLEFCTNQFRKQKIAFFLLIPSYVAARSYYRRILGDTLHDVAYLVPSSEYSYLHPEGTGHEESPFSSLWFCCVGKERIEKLAEEFSSYWNGNEYKKALNRRPKFVASFEELISTGVISLANRPGSKSRKRRRREKMRKLAAESDVNYRISSVDRKNLDQPTVATPYGNNNSKKTSNEKVEERKKRRSSKYRNKSGERTKKRF